MVAQIKPGDSIPNVPVKEQAPDKAAPLDLQGKDLICRSVFREFTTPCNGHIRPFMKRYQEFKAKGVNKIFIVGVNDSFVKNAWKEFLAPSGSPIHFIADDKAAFVSSLGLAFDASDLLGGPRSKRFAIVTDPENVVSVAVEEAPPNVTVSSAESLLPKL